MSLNLNLFKFQRKASNPKTQVEEPPSTFRRIRPRTRSHPHVGPTTTTTTTTTASTTPNAKRTSHIYSIPPAPGMVGILITNGVQMTVRYESEVPYTGPLPEHSTAFVQPVPTFRPNGKLSLFIDNRHFIALILDVTPYVRISEAGNTGVGAVAGDGTVSAVGSGDAPRIATQIFDFTNESLAQGTPYLDIQPNLSPTNKLGLLSMIPESGVPQPAPTLIVYPTPSITTSKNAALSPGASNQNHQSQEEQQHRLRQGSSASVLRRRAETLSTAAECISRIDQERFHRVQIEFLNTGPSLAGTTPRIEALLQQQLEEVEMEDEVDEDGDVAGDGDEQDQGGVDHDGIRRMTLQAKMERMLATPPKTRRMTTDDSYMPSYFNAFDGQGTKKNTLSPPSPSPVHKHPHGSTTASPSPSGGGLASALGLKGVAPAGSTSHSLSPRGRIRRISTAAVPGGHSPTTPTTVPSTTTPAPVADIKVPRSRKPSSSSVSGTSIAVRSTSTPVPRPGIRERVGSETSRRSNNNSSVATNNNTGNLVRARTVQGHPHQQPQSQPPSHSCSQSHSQVHTLSHVHIQPIQLESQPRSYGLLGMGHRKPPPPSIAVVGGHRLEDTQNVAETRTRKVSDALATAGTNVTAANSNSNANSMATATAIANGNTNAKMGLGSKKTKTGFWHGLSGFAWGGGGGGSKVTEAEGPGPGPAATAPATTAGPPGSSTPADAAPCDPFLDDASSGPPSLQSSRFRLEPRLTKAASWESFNEPGWKRVRPLDKGKGVDTERDRGRDIERGNGKSKLRDMELLRPLDRRTTPMMTAPAAAKGDQAAPAVVPRQRRASHQASVTGSSSGIYASSSSGARRNVLSTSTTPRPYPYPAPSAGMSSPRSGMSSAESRRLSARKDLPPIPYHTPLSPTPFRVAGSSGQSPVTRSHIREETQNSKDRVADREKEEIYVKPTSLAGKTTLGDVLNLTPPPRLALTLTGALISPMDYSMFESQTFEASSLAMHPSQTQTQTHPHESSDNQYTTHTTTRLRKSSDTQRTTHPEPENQSMSLDPSPAVSTTPSPITPDGKITMAGEVSVLRRERAKIFEAVPTPLERMRRKLPSGSVESLTTETEHPESTPMPANVANPVTAVGADPSGSNSTLSSGAGAVEYQTAPSTAYTPSTVSGSWNLSVGGELAENGVPLERAGKLSGAARAYLNKKTEVVPMRIPAVAHPVVVHPPGRAVGAKRLPIEKF